MCICLTKMRPFFSPATLLEVSKVNLLSSLHHARSRFSPKFCVPSFQAKSTLEVIRGDPYSLLMLSKVSRAVTVEHVTNHN